MKKKVLILGAGPAGAAAAESAAITGADVTLCGMEPYPPYYRPQLTKALSEPADIGRLLIHKPEWYAERGITLLTGTAAERIDIEKKTVILTKGGEAPWDALVLAAGASPNMPTVAGVNHTLTLRGYDDALAVRKAALEAGSAVVVGGGLLGLESAWELNAAGVKTTLVERGKWLMPRQLNCAGGEVLQRRLESSGLGLVIGRDPSELGELYRGSCVLLCAGVGANLSYLSGSGVAVNRSVVVDGRMRTNIEDIYACGDIAEYNGRNWGLLPVAQEQGKVAGANAAGGDETYVETPPSPMLKIGAHAVFSVGDVSEGEGIVSLSKEKDEGYACLMLKDEVLVGAVLIGNTAMGVKLKKAVAEKRRLAGAKSVQDAIILL